MMLSFPKVPHSCQEGFSCMEYDVSFIVGDVFVARCKFKCGV